MSFESQLLELQEEESKSFEHISIPSNLESLGGRNTSASDRALSSMAIDVKTPRLGTSLEGQDRHNHHHHTRNSESAVASTMPTHQGEASGFAQHVSKTKTFSESQADTLQVARMTEELKAEYNQLVLSDYLTCEKFDMDLKYCLIRADTSDEESIYVT